MACLACLSDFPKSVLCPLLMRAGCVIGIIDFLGFLLGYGLLFGIVCVAFMSSLQPSPRCHGWFRLVAGSVS